MIFEKSSLRPNTLIARARRPVSTKSDKILAAKKDAISGKRMSDLKDLLSNTNSLLVMNAKTTAAIQAIAF